MTSQPLSLLILTYNTALHALSEPLGPALAAASPPDLVFISVQEFCSSADIYLPLHSKEENEEIWTRSVNDALKENYGARRTEYVQVARRSSGGVLLLLFARSTLKVQGLATTAFGIGPILWLPNKALVATRVTLDLGAEKPFVVSLVAAHFNAHPGGVNLAVRNWQASEVFKRTCFEVPSESGDSDTLSRQPLIQPGATTELTLWDSDAVFIAGDLNFRLTCNRRDTLAALDKTDYVRLLETSDELSKARKMSSHGLHPFLELPISWPPSYKYKGPTEFSKTRDPSYTDRILASFHHERGSTSDIHRTFAKCPDAPSDNLPIVQRTYECHTGYSASDHKPVSATFLILPNPSPRIFTTTLDPWRDWKTLIGGIAGLPIGLLLHGVKRPGVLVGVLAVVGVLVWVGMRVW
jgi:hypothetical protein